MAEQQPEFPMKFIRLDGHVEGAAICWDNDHKTIIACERGIVNRNPVFDLTVGSFGDRL